MKIYGFRIFAFVIIGMATFNAHSLTNCYQPESSLIIVNSQNDNRYGDDVALPFKDLGLDCDVLNDKKNGETCIDRVQAAWANTTDETNLYNCYQETKFSTTSIANCFGCYFREPDYNNLWAPRD